MKCAERHIELFVDLADENSPPELRRAKRGGNAFGQLVRISLGPQIMKRVEDELYIAEPVQPRVFAVWQKKLEEYRGKLELVV